MPDGGPIRVGLVGLGNSGRHYHLPLITRDPRYLLAGVATTGGGPEGDLGVPWFAGWQPLLEQRDLDLVVIAAPHAAHHRIAAAALDRGLHVLVEKPMTVSTAEADDLIRRARSSGAVLAVHAQRRWEADFQALAGLVRRGEIGVPWRIAASRGHQNDYVAATRDRPHAAATVLPWARARADGGGVMRVIGPHPIDHALRLADVPARTVSARLSVAPGEEVERWAGIEVDFEGALTARVEVFRRQGPPAPRFAVWGEAGAAVATDGSRLIIRPHEGEERLVRGLAAPGRLGQEIYDDVAAAIRDGAPLRATAEQAREVVRIIEAAEESHRSGGIAVSVAR